MIVYDSHDLTAFLKVRGSIFPRAILYGLVPASFAFCLKYFELLDTNLEGLNQGTIYSGFTFVLGFILVFRTSQSYSRYWMAATAVHTMRAEWCDACGSLIAFAQCSKRPQKEVNAFSHTVIRLFGLMHAMALEEIATLKDENFPLLDIAGLDKRDLHILCCDAAQGRKVEVVCQWIKVFILRSHEQGILNVDAPILTRVFQELGTGLVHYHEAVQVVIWPFPFPYAQMSAVLIAVYMFVTPFVISLWTSEAWYCGIATLISVVCMKGIDLIAIELENPFGDDPNDLPTWQMHHAMNRDLVLLIHPQTWTIPRLLPSAKMTYNELITVNETNRLSLDEYYNKQDESTLKRRFRLSKNRKTVSSALSFQSFPEPSSGGGTKATGMQSWARQNFGDHMSRVARLLNLDKEDQPPGILATISGNFCAANSTKSTRNTVDSVFGRVLPTSPTNLNLVQEESERGAASASLSHPGTAPRQRSRSLEQIVDDEASGSEVGARQRLSLPVGPLQQDLRNFLADFSTEMKEHLAEHRRSQEAFLDKSLSLLRESSAQDRGGSHARRPSPERGAQRHESFSKQELEATSEPAASVPPPQGRQDS
mmetsp:Transcript_17561/g.40848  ORF Transcript_17561/g.40848 Transcript_17561/m.40848 type:complete len:595 (+) Transcript_17561:96-1880(+)